MKKFLAIITGIMSIIGCIELCLYFVNLGSLEYFPFEGKFFHIMLWLYCYILPSCWVLVILSGIGGKPKKTDYIFLGMVLFGALFAAGLNIAMTSFGVYVSENFEDLCFYCVLTAFLAVFPIMATVRALQK